MLKETIIEATPEAVGPHKPVPPLQKRNFRHSFFYTIAVISSEEKHILPPVKLFVSEQSYHFLENLKNLEKSAKYKGLEYSGNVNRNQGSILMEKSLIHMFSLRNENVEKETFGILL